MHHEVTSTKPSHAAQYEEKDSQELHLGSRVLASDLGTSRSRTAGLVV